MTSSRLLVLLPQRLLDLELAQVGALEELFACDVAVLAAVVDGELVFNAFVRLELLPVQLRLLLHTQCTHVFVLLVFNALLCFTHQC